MVKRLFFVFTAIALGSGAMAQETQPAEGAKKGGCVDFGLVYTTELQSDFKKAKWVNLLRMDFAVPIAKGLALRASTLSTAQTDEQPLVNDLQGFSNIEAENIALTLTVMSLDWETKSTTLSVGVRNLNENYFASELTSFFTQSSHGIFPTLSANFNIANFPVASLGADFQWRIKEFTIDASLYNGVGYKNFGGRDNLFRFCPKSDGIFTALQLSHEAAYGNSHIGAALRKGKTAMWAYSELNLNDNTQLLAQYSIAPGRGMECSQFAALGVKRSMGRVEIGLAENFARFAEADEWTTELSARMPISGHLTLQPVVHVCHTGNDTHCIALLRLCCEL